MTVLRTRIKFCGITRPEDADAAVRAGADAIGLVFADGSPRCITLEAAAALRRRLPPLVHAVALLRNAPADFVERVLSLVRPDLLQFHGEEPPAFCRRFARAYIRAVPMKDGADLARWARDFADAAALLLDGHGAGEPGGQGQTFDWSKAAAVGKPLVLAGGLTPENVGDAVRRVRPYAVDVSSGIESSPGVKDQGKMQRFVEQVRRADER